jgi:hypothetical protein
MDQRMFCLPEIAAATLIALQWPFSELVCSLMIISFCKDFERPKNVRRKKKPGKNYSGLSQLKHVQRDNDNYCNSEWVKKISKH